MQTATVTKNAGVISLHSATFVYPQTHQRPATFEEFYKKWLPKFKTCVYSKMYRYPECVDDIAQDLMTEFFEKGLLEAYDPSRAAFSTFVYGFLLPRVQGYTARETKKIDRMRSIDDLVSDNVDTSGETGVSHDNISLKDINNLSDDAPEVDLDAQVYVKVLEIADALNQEVAPKCSRNLGQIFILLFTQACEGTPHFGNIARYLGVSNTAVSNHKAKLIETLMLPKFVEMLRDLVTIRDEPELSLVDAPQAVSMIDMFLKVAR